MLSFGIEPGQQDGRGKQIHWASAAPNLHFYITM